MVYAPGGGPLVEELILFDPQVHTVRTIVLMGTMLELNSPELTFEVGVELSAKQELMRYRIAEIYSAKIADLYRDAKK